MYNMNLRQVLAVAKNVLTWLNGDVANLVVTLGSGLGGYGADLPGAREISYAKLGLPKCGAAGHAGVLRYVKIGGLGVLILDGRVHRYEGHSYQTVVLAVRALVFAGVKDHIITCASGGVDPQIKPGELVIIRDHINFMDGNPLIGKNHKRESGPRFPDMTEAYDCALRQVALAAGHSLDMDLREGVYIAMTGPAYETPAEVRMQRALGADMCGMSTVPEVIAIRHLGGRVLGISCVANHAAGVAKEPLSHAEVVAACSAAAPRFRALLTAIIHNLQS
jgi:purine-nucleoside phosphorylase